jgi:hypothetical protein
MGIHRDGVKWELEPDVVEQRRYMFLNGSRASLTADECFGSARPRMFSRQIAFHDRERQVVASRLC